MKYIFTIILIYVIYKIFSFISVINKMSKSKVKATTPNNSKKINPDDIIEADYEEINNSNNEK